LVAEVACWVLIGRKFYDSRVATSSPIAADALTRIGRLH
jgi:hypothetical protein